MRRFKYETPAMEIVAFVTEDVITTSGGQGGEPVPTEEPYEPALPWD